MLLRYSQEIRDWPLFLLATSLAFLFASRIAAQPDSPSGYRGLGFSLTLGVASHLLAIFLVPPVCGFLFTLPGVRRTIRWRKLIPAVAIPVGVFLIMAYFYLHPSLNPLSGELDKSQWWVPPLSREVISITVTNLFGLSWFPLSLYETKRILLVMLPWLAIALDFGNWRRSLPFLIATLTFWLEIIGYSILVTPLFHDRFLLPSLIPLSGFFALQIASIERKTLRIESIVICAAVCLIFALSWATKRASEPTEPFKQMSQYLASQWPGNGIVIFYPGDYAFLVNYYCPRLPPTAVLKVRSTSGEEELTHSISSKIDSINKSGVISQVFLVVRYDGNAANGHRALQSALSILKDQTKGDVTLTVLSFDCGRPVENLLTAITSVLGPPSWVREPGPFVAARFVLNRAFPPSLGSP